MAAKRAILFRIGTVGLTCAAFEIAIEAGSQDRKGTIRPVRDCTNLATELVASGGTYTRLCATCAPIFRDAIARGAVMVAEKINDGRGRPIP